MTPKEALEVLRRFFKEFENSKPYEDYLEATEHSDDEYGEAWQILEDHFAGE